MALVNCEGCHVTQRKNSRMFSMNYTSKNVTASMSQMKYNYFYNIMWCEVYVLPLRSNGYFIVSLW